MELLKLFASIEEERASNQKLKMSLAYKESRYLKLMAQCFKYQHSRYSLTEAEIDELAKEKDWMLKVQKELQQAASVDKLTFVYEAILGEGTGLADLYNPNRGKAGTFIIQVPTTFIDVVREQVSSWRARQEEERKKPTVYTKQQLTDFGLQAYCDGSTEAAAAKIAEMPLISFRSALSKFSRDKEKMETMLGPRWRNRAESLGILTASPGRQKLIETIADGRVNGKSVVELAKEHKLSLGNITSALAYIRNQGDQFLYNRYFPKFGESWKSKSTIAFENKHYAPGMREEFLEAGGSEREFNKQQVSFHFPDGYILA